MKLVSILDQVVESTAGHIIRFHAGEPITVPPDPTLIADCLAKGCLPADKVDEKVMAAARARNEAEQELAQEAKTVKQAGEAATKAQIAANNRKE